MIFVGFVVVVVVVVVVERDYNICLFCGVKNNLELILEQ